MLFKYYLKQTLDKIKAFDSSSRHTNTRKVFFYTSAAAISSSFYLRKPLCMVRLRNGKFGAIHTNDQIWIVSGFGFVGVECHICLFKFSFDRLQHTSTDVDIDTISNYCIAIPNQNVDNNHYIIMDDEWKELDANMTFVYGYR